MTGTVEDPGQHTGGPAARAVPFLVVALECDRLLSGSARFGLERIDRVTVGRGTARGALRTESQGVVTLDLRLPGTGLSSAHARMVRVGDAWAIEDTGSKNGTFVNGVRVERAVLGPNDVVTAGRALLCVTRPLLTPVETAQDVDSENVAPRRGHVTLDPELEIQLEALERVARSDLSVLIRGETGTGKEVLARAVHALSGRTGELVAVNCGAIPAALVESHLFGHVKGAFSGAVRDEPGLFRAANGGTLFLDEIGDLPRPSQVALLRALQEREVLPVGATRPVKVDLRVVAATHQHLEAMVESGEFRRDLLARLTGFVVELPPLRARPMDLGLLVAAILRQTSSRRPSPPTMTPEAALTILRYSWPQNTRELEQALGRALILAGDAPIDVRHLPDMDRATETKEPASNALTERDLRLRHELLDNLARHKGNLADVAREMGKARMQIHRWCKRFGVDPNAFRR